MPLSFQSDPKPKPEPKPEPKPPVIKPKNTPPPELPFNREVKNTDLKQIERRNARNDEH